MRVVFYNIGQVNCVSTAVRQVSALHAALAKGGAGFVCHWVNNAEQCVWKRHSRKALCVVHSGAGLAVALVGWGQVRGYHFNCLHSKRVGIIISGGGNIRFNCMGQRVHAGVRYKLLRHCLCKLGVNYCNIRCYIKVRQRVLNALWVIGNYRESGNLRSSSRGWGNSAEFSLLAKLGEIKGNAERLKGNIGVFIKRPHSLCRVYRGAAAYCNYPVRLEFTHSLGAAHNGFNRGVWLNTLKQLYLHSRLFKVIYCLIKKAETLHRAAAHNYYSLFAFEVFQVFHCVFAEINISG